MEAVNVSKIPGQILALVDDEITGVGKHDGVVKVPTALLPDAAPGKTFAL